LCQSRLKQGEEGRVTDFSKCNDGDGDDEDEYEDEDNVDEGLFAYRWQEGAAIRDLDGMLLRPPKKKG
jgi:hypothetical protein